MDERAVRPIFQNAPHQIAQQDVMRADRRIHAAQQTVAAYKIMKFFAHAVKALEFDSSRIDM